MKLLSKLHRTIAPKPTKGAIYMEHNLDLSVREVLNLMQSRIITNTKYFGIQALKCPIDFWVYQEIIYETRPDFIIEIGNYHGGSTLALAHLCDCLGKGKVIGCDLSHQQVPPQVRNHPRISLLEGDACQLFDRVVELIGKQANVLVIEDSSHSYENTLAVLRTYSPLIQPGQYFIVEDGICHHGLSVGPNPGPYEAIETFLAENENFEADRSREAFFITWNPKGYLRRKA
jgi:cephalosporin hydroxylase